MTDRSEKKRQMFVRMLFTYTSKHSVYTSPDRKMPNETTFDRLISLLLVGMTGVST